MPQIASHRGRTHQHPFLSTAVSLSLPEAAHSINPSQPHLQPGRRSAITGALPLQLCSRALQSHRAMATAPHTIRAFPSTVQSTDLKLFLPQLWPGRMYTATAASMFLPQLWPGRMYTATAASMTLCFTGLVMQCRCMSSLFPPPASINHLSWHQQQLQHPGTLSRALTALPVKWWTQT